MIKTTKAQRQALFRVFKRDWPNHLSPFWRLTGQACPHCGKPVTATQEKVRTSSGPYRRFRKTATPYYDGSGCIMIPWKGMWLGIETDGYTHS